MTLRERLAEVEIERDVLRMNLTGMERWTKKQVDEAFIDGMRKAVEIMQNTECKSEAYDNCTRCSTQAVEAAISKRAVERS